MRTYLLITLFFLSLLGSGFYLKNSYVPPKYAAVIPLPINVSTEASSTTPDPVIHNIKTVPATDTLPPMPLPTGTPNPMPTVTPTPTPVDTPAPSPTPIIESACGTGGSCTTAEVAKHNTPTDCWVMMAQLGRVYNVTAYVSDGSPLHPGGDIIAPYCGQDIYDIFMGNTGDHTHSLSAMNVVLASYDIGALN